MEWGIVVGYPLRKSNDISLAKLMKRIDKYFSSLLLGDISEPSTGAAKNDSQSTTRLSSLLEGGTMESLKVGRGRIR